MHLFIHVFQHANGRGQDDVYDLSWSPDSLVLASASTDCSVRVWDLKRSTLVLLFPHTFYMFSLLPGRQVQNLTDHTHYVQGVSWDPRGRYLLTQSSDRSCRLYDIKKRGKGKQLATALVLRERTDDTKEVAFVC
jgi:chromatin assembly factor 1 subunit B